MALRRCDGGEIKELRSRPFDRRTGLTGTAAGYTDADPFGACHGKRKRPERPPLTAVTVCGKIGMYCFYGAGNIEICFIPLTESAVSILKAENTAFDDFWEIG